MVKAIRPSSLLCHGNLKVDVSWRKLKDVHVFWGLGDQKHNGSLVLEVVLFGKHILYIIYDMWLM